MKGPTTPHRQDLADAAKGDDGRAHVISVRVAGTRFNLNCTPRILEGTAGRDTDNLTLALDHHPFTFGLFIDRLLGESSTEHLILKVRSDFGRDPTRTSNFRSNMEQLMAHQFATRLDFTTPANFPRVIRRTA